MLEEIFFGYFLLLVPCGGFSSKLIGPAGERERERGFPQSRPMHLEKNGSANSNNSLKSIGLRAGLLLGFDVLRGFDLGCAVNIPDLPQLRLQQLVI